MNDSRPQNMLVRAAPAAGDRGKTRAILGVDQHTDILSHPRRLPHRSRAVNPLNGSVHYDRALAGACIPGSIVYPAAAIAVLMFGAEGEKVIGGTSINRAMAQKAQLSGN